MRYSCAWCMPPLTTTIMRIIGGAGRSDLRPSFNAATPYCLLTGAERVSADADIKGRRGGAVGRRTAALSCRPHDNSEHAPRCLRLRSLRAPGLAQTGAPLSIPGLYERSAGGTTILSVANSGRGNPTNCAEPGPGRTGQGEAEHPLSLLKPRQVWESSGL